MKGALVLSLYANERQPFLYNPSSLPFLVRHPATRHRENLFGRSLTILRNVTLQLSLAPVYF